MVGLVIHRIESKQELWGEHNMHDNEKKGNIFLYKKYDLFSFFVFEMWIKYMTCLYDELNVTC